MAIIKMKKLSAIVLKQETRKLLRALHKAGVVEISQVQREDSDLFESQETGLTLTRLEEKLSDVRFALGVIKKHDHSKKPFYLVPKPAIAMDEFENFAEKYDEVSKAIESIRQADETLNIIRQKQSRISAQISQIEPFAGMDIKVGELSKMANVRALCGFMPKNVIASVLELSGEFDGMAYVEQVGDGTGELVPILAVAHRSVSDEFVVRLKEFSFSEIRFEGFDGTCKDRINGLQCELDELTKEQAAGEAAAQEVVSYKPLLQTCEDFLQNEIAREAEFAKFGATSNVNIIQGWFKYYDEEKVKNIFETNTSAYYLTTAEPDENDVIPTAVETKKLLTPFQVVTEMYDTPNARELDASVFLAPFYFIFFGMMLSDAAYGVLLSILMAVVLIKKKPTKGSMSRKVMGTLCICGVSTLIWGALFGSWFGEQLIPALWFVPTEGNGPLMMLIACFSLGYIHIVASLIAGMVLCFRRHDVAGALFDKGLWLVVLLSVLVMLIDMIFGTNINSMTIGLYIMLAGFVGLILTQGRAKKGIVRKFIGGLASVYDVTSYLSDILSYARIFGMSLATGVIAHVFNVIATMMFGNVVGFICGIVIMLIGHGFNLAINALGSFVHSCRLQYIESFPKFFEGGGKPFRPLTYKLANHRFEEN